MVTRTVTVASFGLSGYSPGKVRYIRWIVVDIGRPEDGADALVVRMYVVEGVRAAHHAPRERGLVFRCARLT